MFPIYTELFTKYIYGTSKNTASKEATTETRRAKERKKKHKQGIRAGEVMKGHQLPIMRKENEIRQQGSRSTTTPRNVYRRRDYAHRTRTQVRTFIGMQRTSPAVVHRLQLASDAPPSQ